MHTLHQRYFFFKSELIRVDIYVTPAINYNILSLLSGNFPATYSTFFDVSNNWQIAKRFKKVPSEKDGARNKKRNTLSPIT